MALIETRDGTKLFYRDWGQGDVVVFVASQAVPGDIWNYNVPPLVESGLRCVTFDRRGHGRSDEPGHGYDIDTLADDLRAVLVGLDLRDITLIGHSLGGAEVIRYLGKHHDDHRACGSRNRCATYRRFHKRFASSFHPRGHFRHDHDYRHSHRKCRGRWS